MGCTLPSHTYRSHCNNIQVIVRELNLLTFSSGGASKHFSCASERLSCARSVKANKTLKCKKKTIKTRALWNAYPVC